MSNRSQSIDNLLNELKERAKELSCLYQVEELTNNSDLPLEEVLRGIVDAIPHGWQYPDICKAKITYGDGLFIQSPNFTETKWVQEADIIIQDTKVGVINVYYTQEMPTSNEGPFMKEERKLISTIADRVGHFILHKRLKEVFTKSDLVEQQKRNWSVIMDLLRRTDPQLLMRISRKMTNYLCWSGFKEADELLERFTPMPRGGGEFGDEENRPHQKKAMKDFMLVSDDVFRIASDYLNEDEILALIQKWIKEDKSGFLVNILENPGSSLAEIIDAIGRFHHLGAENVEISAPREKGFRVSLIRRLLTDQSEFINIAKNYLCMDDFYDLLHHVIFPVGSHGKLGGKSAGLFLASQILKKEAEKNKLLQTIKTPKTWYLTSDGVLNFLHYNNLEDVVEQKYKRIEQVRQEYPYIVQVFKNSHFSPEIVKGLSMALDDFGDRPLVVRSSSLLEDRMGTAFAGKYKSLFIANQGSRKERLEALMDAISEVYSSMFSPDPIEYRAERGLIDFHEEMGIMIQEVVGTKVGHYFLPAYAGVAFSNNEFRWSPRIKRDDGLIRAVPGLGTRAVDRLSDDYPILIAPGQPDLRANVTIDEFIRYSPKKIDVINLETNTFETIDIRELLRQYGDQYPKINQILSIVENDRIRPPTGLLIDFENDDLIVTFDLLMRRTDFVKRLHTIIKILHDAFDNPVDIEFACNGNDFYLLQCRPQSHGRDSKPDPIPTNIPPEKLLFSANRYISNGGVPDITHIVYVDPQKYSEIEDRAMLLNVGRAVGRLNQILPKRQFILMGPGRWGSRGDIKLGVSVTYSEINNTAVLIEIARKKGNYVPDLSFGTHFFQDLVEASIRYLPLYPDDDGVAFNDDFFQNSPNVLADILPEFDDVQDTVRVIDVAQATDGKILKVLMNGDLDKALGVLGEPTRRIEPVVKKHGDEKIKQIKPVENHWRWRLRMAEKIASQLDTERFGVKAFYVFGSTKNATAGPGSDIDLLVHFQGTDKQRNELQLWLDGWSLCLAEMNFLRTGHKSDGLLDVHFVTDTDIRNRTSYAVKIGAVTDAARPLPLKEK